MSLLITLAAIPFAVVGLLLLLLVVLMIFGAFRIALGRIWRAVSPEGRIGLVLIGAGLFCRATGFLM